MTDVAIFGFGLLVTLLAVGPLFFAWYLDEKDKQN
jgi:hypothetical protein